MKKVFQCSIETEDSLIYTRFIKADYACDAIKEFIDKAIADTAIDLNHSNIGFVATEIE